jgi:hypothetical protein
MPTALNQGDAKRYRQLSVEFDEALNNRDIDKAKRIIATITPILRGSGQEAKLNKFKIAYFELLLDMGDVEKAASGARGIMQRMPVKTRTHLEAAFLYAICHFRKGEIQTAETLIGYVMKNESAISSLDRRIEFKRVVGERAEVEGLMAHMKGLGMENLDCERVAQRANKLVKKSKKELINQLGDAAPGEAVLFTRKLRDSSRRLLPYNERLRIMDKDQELESEQVGVKLMDAFKRQLFDSLCNPKSDTYKNYFDRPLKGVAWSTPLAAHIVQYLKQQGMCWWGLAVPLVALFVKIGVGTFCERSRPQRLMVDRR